MTDEKETEKKGEDDSPSAVLGSTAPTVMCKWFGHKWTYKAKLQERRGGELWNICKLVHLKTCVRCGQLNLNYEGQ